MENGSKVFAMAILCFLGILVASNALSGVNRRALAGENAGNGKPNEPDKVSSSSPPISAPIQNTASSVQGHNLPPQPSKSLPNSENSDLPSSKSSPLVDISTKIVPPPGPEDNTSLNPPTKEDHKDSEAPKKEGDKPVQSPKKEDHLAPPDLEKGGGMTSHDPREDNVPKGSQEIEPGNEKSENETCKMAISSTFTCQKGMLVACLLHSGSESTEFILLVQNTGPDDLNVNLKSASNIKLDSKSLNLPKHSKKKVKLAADASRGLIITLNTGDGEDCVIQTKTLSSNWFNFEQFPAYAAQVRPMHGAYFLFATITIIGATWACCKFGKAKKRVDAGIPYQQLEMATTNTQTTSMAVDEAPADGWDQSWDDNWDDEEAVVRPADKHPTENGPSNGLSSRSANPTKDGWEIDWDD